MTILPLIAACAVILAIAYVTYGKLIMKWFGADDSRKTPAVEFEDGSDYVPASVPVVLGGHFTAIAAAGPVVGPIMAASMFGWVPALLWILLGSIFIGGIHDAGALLASIRHKAQSIMQVVRTHMSRRAYLLFLGFVWLSLIYVIIAFADVTAGSFAAFEKFEMKSGDQLIPLSINGGAVAIGASAYLLFSVALGLLLRFTKTPWWLGLVAACAGLGLVIAFAPSWAAWLADNTPLAFMNTAGETASARTWALVLLIYCFFASVVPMWALLQPRGLIGATFMYVTLAFGVTGAVIGGLFTHDTSLVINWQRAFAGAGGEAAPYLYPVLFITIACGACSGFHSIVGSGTTCKQVRKESDVKPVAYGAMLLEAMVAIFALSCVMVLASDVKIKGTDADIIYARGIGNFMHLTGIPLAFAVSFAMLAFSSFVFDTLDVCTRLGRYVVQELTGLKGIAGGAVATLLTLGLPAAYLALAPAGSFVKFWTIFGTSNQLLAGLTLVGVSVWLWRTGRPVWFALAPAIFMLITTGTALIINFNRFLGDFQKAAADARTLPVINMAVAAVLFVLGLLVALEAIRIWRVSRTATVDIPA